MINITPFSKITFLLYNLYDTNISNIQYEVTHMPENTAETRCGLTYEEFVRRYLENDPYEFQVHIDAIWASMPVDEKPQT